MTVRHRVGLRRPGWVAGLLAATLTAGLTACGEAGGAPAPAPVATPAPAALQAVVAASQLTPGPQRLPIGVLDRGTPVTGAQVHVRLFQGAAAGTVARGEADAPFRGEGLQGGGLYVAQVTLDAAGQWLAAITVRRPDAAEATVAAPFRVLPRATVPMVGEPAIPSRNPTVRDVPDVSEIDSGSPPDDMHALSIADAIEQHRPALVVFATPAFCTSAMCGPEVHAVQLLEPEYRGRLAFIHVEVYRDFRPDPARRQLTPAVLEWRLQTEPWVFLIDARGIVRAEFEGPAATDELRSAVGRLLAG